MQKLLKRSRDQALEGVIAFLWGQWPAVGVAGHTHRGKGGYVDPEALFAFTCAFGRYDARLFDEVLDWLSIHVRFVNVQRMKNILVDANPAVRSAMSASARALLRAVPNAKWKLLTREPESHVTEQPFFLLPDGRPMPLRGKCDPDFLAHGLRRHPVQLRRMSSLFSPDTAGSLLLKLRALLGVNARSEIVLYLLLNQHGNSREIARRTHYFQKTIHDTLVDLECSGYVESSKVGRERRFYLSSQELKNVIMPLPNSIRWVDWPALLFLIESYWRELDELTQSDVGEETIRSELYFMAKRLAESSTLRDSAPPIRPPKPNKTSEEYLQPFLELVDSLG
ncbi:MAG: helix-turn-helix domain-containing protein [Candidatus Hydrogenedentes bacterium]|nr:helix-turn-helix domain-containing protein [Candidatus Hydrogenedentota bacterium]